MGLIMESKTDRLNFARAHLKLFFVSEQVCTVNHRKGASYAFPTVPSGGNLHQQIPNHVWNVDPKKKRSAKYIKNFPISIYSKSDPDLPSGKRTNHHFIGKPWLNQFD
jgi:hypothetical protein